MMLGARFCFPGRIQGGGIKPSPTLLKHGPSRLTSERNSSETLQVFVHSRTEAAVHGTGLVSVFIINPGRCLVLRFLMICHFVHGIMDCKGRKHCLRIEVKTADADHSNKTQINRLILYLKFIKFYPNVSYKSVIFTAYIRETMIFDIMLQVWLNWGQ